MQKRELQPDMQRSRRELGLTWIPALGAFLAIAMTGAAADAAFIIDNFPTSSSLGGNGITVAGPLGGSTTVTDIGVASTSILGGTREATLTLEPGADKANTGVNLKISGGSAQMGYTSDNNTADGLYELIYNGTAGVPAFPLDFTGDAGVTIGVHTHTNPGSNFPTLFSVTLFDSANKTAVATYSLSDGVSGGITLTFGTSLNPFSPQPLFDFSAVKQISVLVDPEATTNLILREIATTAEISTPVPTPEPSSIGLMLLGAAGYCGKRRLARRQPTT